MATPDPNSAEAYYQMMREMEVRADRERERQRYELMRQMAQYKAVFPDPFGYAIAPPPPKPKPKPLPKAGMKVEDLIGWRLWRVTQQGALQSIAHADIWQPDTPMEGAPDDYNDAGVWAFHTRERAERKLEEARQGATVLGSVRMWGRPVIEHEEGYRSQFARIVSIDAITIPGQYPWSLETERALDWLRKRYAL